jgi:hypothetical protein
MAIAISTKISTFSTKTRTLVEKVEVEADPRLAYDLVDPFFTHSPTHPLIIHSLTPSLPQSL